MSGHLNDEEAREFWGVDVPGAFLSTNVNDEPVRELPGLPEVEVVPLDEPSMEDYPDKLIPPDEFGAPPVRVVPVRDGVKDTRS